MLRIQLAHGRGSILMLLLSSCSSCAFLVPPPAARAHTRHAQLRHAAVPSVRMEAKTIMEMPMPNELVDWGALTATAHPPAHPHLYVVYSSAPFLTPHLQLQAWTKSCGARSTGTAGRA